MKNKTRTANIILLIVVVFVMISLAYLYFADKSNNIPNGLYSASVYKFNDGWQFVSADGSVEALELPTCVDVQKCTSLSISKVLPQDIVGGSAMVFRTTAQTVYVYVDANPTPVYSYNTVSQQPYGKATQNNWNTVDIPETYSGKTITLTLLSPYSQYSGQLNSFYFGDRVSLQSFITNAALPSCFFSFFIFLIGIFMLIYFFIISGKKNANSSFMYLAEFMILLSFLIRSEALLPKNLMLSNFIELQISFAALYLAPLPFILLALSRCETKHVKIYRVFFFVFLLNMLVSVVLQIANIYDFYETVYIYFFLLLLLLAYTWFVIISRIIRREAEYPVLEIIGYLCLTVGALSEVLRVILISYDGARLLLAGGVLIYTFCQVVIVARRLRNEAAKSSQLALQLEESKITLMMNQIRPHFLYNTLGAIRTMIISDPDVAYKMTYDFSNYLRANMRALELTSPIPFKEELKNVEAYINIEKVRFGDRLCVVFDIGADDFLIPAISVQLLVENAIKHGACKRAEGGTVIVKTRETMDSYLIIVTDDGVGFDINKSDSSKQSCGLRNLRYRLSVMMNATLTIKSEIGTGTTATIFVPKKTAKVNINENNSCRR